jgi:hypothetical protein
MLCDLGGPSLRSSRLKAFDRKVREGFAKIAKAMHEVTTVCKLHGSEIN